MRTLGGLPRVGSGIFSLRGCGLQRRGLVSPVALVVAQVDSGETPCVSKLGLGEEVSPLCVSPPFPGFSHWTLLQNQRKRTSTLKDSCILRCPYLEFTGLSPLRKAPSQRWGCQFAPSLCFFRPWTGLRFQLSRSGLTGSALAFLGGDKLLFSFPPLRLFDLQMAPSR